MEGRSNIALLVILLRYLYGATIYKPCEYIIHCIIDVMMATNTIGSQTGGAPFIYLQNIY